jgi:putative membrane protein
VLYSRVEMAERDFFDPSAKTRAAEAIKKVESQTSAEIVISVRKQSGAYRAADLWLGAACGMASLAFMIYSPRPFTARTMPVDVLIAFGLGILLSANIATVRRLLSGGKTIAANVDHAAKGSFYDLGIAKTHRRSGILVFASLFEGRAVLVPDAGVDKAAVGDAWAKAEETLSGAVRSRDFAAFIAAVEGLGPVLAPVMPRKEGDENELPDEMQ